MENKFSDVVVGAFVILLTLAVASFVVWITVGTEKIEYTRYQVITDESVSGVTVNSLVSFNGVDVGKVAAINLNKKDPRFVIIDIDLRSDTPIKLDTKAVLKSRGITGLVSVSLVGGDPESATLLPTKEHPIPIIANGPSLGKRLDEAFDQVVGDLARVSENISLFLSEDNAHLINHILENAAMVSDNLKDKSDDMGVLIASISEMMDSLNQQISALTLTGNDGPIENFNAAMESVQQLSKDYSKLSQELLDVAKSVDVTAKSANKSVTQVGPRLSSLLLEIKSMAESMRRLSDNLSKDPNSIIFGKPTPKKGPGE